VIWAEKAEHYGLCEFTKMNLIFVLTEFGYKAGYKYKHPFRHFCKNYWQWLLGSILTFLNVLAATGQVIISFVSK
jgi:uncharacterized membrane protein